MPRYTRLRDSYLANELDLLEKADVGTHYFLESEPVAELEPRPGDLGQWRMEDECFQSKFSSSPSTQQHHTQMHSQQATKGSTNSELNASHRQNIENGNPNVVESYLLTNANAFAQTSPVSGASKLRERVGGGLGSSSREFGLSGSGRWIGKNTAEISSSSKWTAAGEKLFRREEGSVPANVVPNSKTPGEPVARSTQRLVSHREPTLQQTTQARVVEVSGITCVEMQSQSSDVHDLLLPRRVPKIGSVTSVEKRNSSAVSTVTAVLNRSVSVGQSNGLYRESSSAVQRSYSTTDVRTEISPEEWGPKDQSPLASPSHSQKRAAARGRRHRVSFSLADNENHGNLEQLPHREKWRELTSVTRSKVLAAAKDNPDHMTFNYEQPGFVERENDGATGRAYTIYSVNGLKDCSKGSSNRSGQLPLARAFSMREKTSKYSRIARSFSFSTGKHAVPVECLACGRGMGTVVVGFPGPNDSSVCKSCESQQKKKPTKEKSFLHYCRKFLGLSKKRR